MGIDEMDFHWRLNWWYRPTQCDGFGTSVTDYYECFCDWKDSMDIHSCPADEADYIDAFIQNLKPDIRLRLESKGRSRRLKDVFSDAKFEESMVFLDDAFKRIEAKFEAHKLFDKMSVRINSEKDRGLIVAATYIDESPIDKRAESTVGPQPIQGEDMSVKVYYDQFCNWISKSKAVNYIGDEESHVDEFFYGLRKDLRERVLQSKWKTYRLSDALRRAQIDETFLSWEKDYGHNNANDVFEGMPNPKSEHIDELQVAEDVGDAQSNELVVQIEAESWKIVSLVAACSVLDELTEPDIEEMPHSNSINLDAVRGSCNDMSIEEHRVVDKVLESEPSGGLKPFAAGVQCMNRAKEFKLAEPEMVMVGYQMFDETPELICMKHFEVHNGNDNSTPLIVYIRWIFDPGSVATEHARPNGSTILEIEGTFTPLLVRSLIMPWPSFCIYNELIQPSVIETASSKSSTGNFCSISIVEKVGMFSLNAGVQLMDTGRELFLSKEGLKSCEYSAVCLPNDWGYEASVIIILELDVYFCVDVLPMIIFDPGGSPLHYKGFSSLKPNSVMQNLYFRLNDWDSARVNQCWIDLYSRHETDLVYLAFGECKNIIYFSCYDALFLFDPGGSYHLLGAWNRNGDFEIGEEKKRPLALTHICLTFYQEAPSLTNGHVIANPDVYVTAAAIQRMRGLEDVYHLFGKGPDQLPVGQRNGDVIHDSNMGPANCSSGMIVDRHEDNLQLGKHPTGNFRMLHGSHHFLERISSGGHKNVFLLMVIILESFVWDPGVGAYFFSSYITCSVGHFGEHSHIAHPWGQGCF